MPDCDGKPESGCRKEPIGCRFCDDTKCWECYNHGIIFMDQECIDKRGQEINAQG
jgi:hypothetical protein